MNTVKTVNTVDIDPRVVAPRSVSHSSAERGQATTEYALLLLGVAAVALLVAAWAADSGQVGALLDRVFQAITSRVP